MFPRDAPVTTENWSKSKAARRVGLGYARLRWAIRHPSSILLHVALLVDGHVISGADVVRGMDGLGAKAQVADGDTSTLLRVVLEVGLTTS